MSHAQTQQGPFFIAIAGLPREYTWQDLKDLIRAVGASRGVWTEICIQNGQTTGKGNARLGRWEEADALYRHLYWRGVQERGVNVHLYSIAASPPELIACNCPSHPEYGNSEVQWVARLNRDPTPWIRVSPVTSPIEQGFVAYAMSTQSASAATVTQQMSALHVSPQQQAYPTESQREQSYYPRVQQPVTLQIQQQTPHPRPSYTRNGIAINTERGTVQTESRGIFVGNLSFRARERDIQAKFRRGIGDIVHFKLLTDSAGKSKGSALISYSTPEEALRAKETFDGTEWMNRKLQVREDTERVTISAPASNNTRRTNGQPVILNGSGGSRSGRQ